MSKKLDTLKQSWRDYNGLTPTVESIIDHAEVLEKMLKRVRNVLYTPNSNDTISVAEIDLLIE